MYHFQKKKTKDSVENEKDSLRNKASLVYKQPFVRPEHEGEECLFALRSPPQPADSSFLRSHSRGGGRKIESCCRVNAYNLILGL